jgi:hypothetical protein
LRVVDIESLAQAFAQHAATCRSSGVLCTVHVAFESWFRLELAQTLLTNLKGNISFDCWYTNSSCKGDLLFEVNDGKAAFELKSFVRGSDANKLAKFPRQLELLKKAVADGTVAQGVAFCTFIGYTNVWLDRVREKLFPVPWETTNLKPILADKPLRFMVAGIEA